MRRYGWVFNLDAELELLRGRPGYVPQRKLLAQLAQHGKSSRELMAATDVELDLGSPVPRDFAGELGALPRWLSPRCAGTAWNPSRTLTQACCAA